MWEYKEWSEYVVCIDDSIGNSRLLSLNKSYKTRKITTDEKIKYRLPTNYIILELDALSCFENRLPVGCEVWCDEKCFISLEEFRDKKLDQLL
jgi:hypothetical protein